MTTISTIFPSIDTNLQHHEVKVTSPMSVVIQPWQTTNYSNSTATWTMPPPSASVFMDRCLLRSTPVTITFAGTTTGSALLQANYQSLRAYPMASITISDILQLNNQSFNLMTSELVPWMARYWSKTKHTDFPSYMDTYSDYIDGVAAMNNPLGQYFNSVGNVMPRGSFPMIIVNGATAATITATIIEPVWLPCLHREVDDGVGFTNITTCTLTTNYSSNLNMIICNALGTGNLATFSGITVALGQGTIYCKYSSPPIGYVPRPMSYGSENLSYQTYTMGSSLAADTSRTGLSSGNIQLQFIPTWALIFVREANANRTYNSSDSACNISNLAITFDNTTGILSSATEVSLYEMAKHNGLQDSWEQYHGQISNLATQVGTSGSFLKLFFGSDIQLQAGKYPGMEGQYNFQITNITFKNTSQTTAMTQPTLYIIFSTQSKLIIHENGQNIEVVTGVSGGEGEYVPFDELTEHYGGSFKSFMGKVWKGIKKVHNFVKDNKLVSTIAKQIPIPQAQMVAQKAAEMGYGDYDAGMVVAGSEGGRKMTRAQLKRRIRNM